MEPDRPDIKARVAEMIKADEANFSVWWNKLSPERQNQYQSLPIISSDGGTNQHYHLKKCRYLLELINDLTTSENKSFHPQGLAIHGSNPTVFVQVDGQETPKWETLKSLTMCEDLGRRTIYSDIDTSPFGVPATEAGIWKFKLEDRSVAEKLSSMK